jgi:two-component system, cell cycle response regulator DivK
LSLTSSLTAFPKALFFGRVYFRDKIDFVGIIRACQKCVPDKKRILIVEDNADARNLLAMVLARFGYEVDQASTGVAALNCAQRNRPDLIIMDLGLPEMSGDEATVRLKADPTTKAIPVIVNTAMSRQSPQVARAIAAGAATVLYKPTPLKSFQEIAQRYLAPEYAISA